MLFFYLLIFVLKLNNNYFKVKMNNTVNLHVIKKEKRVLKEKDM
jgi:hypothetical protein